MSGNGKVTAIAIAAAWLGAVGAWAASAQDKYALKVPNGIAFSEFRGYESWQVVSISHGGLLAVIVGNQTIVDAYRAGIPDNGRPFPDGSRMAKIHWTPKSNPDTPGTRVDTRPRSCLPDPPWRAEIGQQRAAGPFREEMPPP